MSTNRYRPPFMAQTSREEHLRRQAAAARQQQQAHRPCPQDVIDLIEVAGVWMTPEDAARR